MKEALKIGFNTAIDHWLIILKTSFLFLILVGLVSFLESLLLHEIILFIKGAFGISMYNSSTSLFTTSLDMMSIKTHYYEIPTKTMMVLNSFWVGVYYAKVGFPKKESGTPYIDEVLDLPFNNSKENSIVELIQGIGRKEWREYLLCVTVFVLIKVSGSYVGIFSWSFSYLIYWLQDRVAFIMLVFLYWRWARVSTVEWFNKKDMLEMSLVFILLYPSLVNCTLWFVVESIISVVRFFRMEYMDVVAELVSILLNLIGHIILLPFVAIVYSQTLLNLTNESDREKHI